MGKYTKEQKEHIAHEFCVQLIQQGLNMDDAMELIEELLILVREGKQDEFNSIIESAIHRAKSKGE